MRPVIGLAHLKQELSRSYTDSITVSSFLLGDMIDRVDQTEHMYKVIIKLAEIIDAYKQAADKSYKWAEREIERIDLP